MQTDFAVPSQQKTTLPEGFSVAQILEERAHDMRKRRKRVRTRAALLAVAAREIEKWATIPLRSITSPVPLEWFGVRFTSTSTAAQTL